MPTILQIKAVLIGTIMLSCDRPTAHTSNNGKQDTTKIAMLVDTPRSFVKNYGSDDTSRLFAFVGEKILVEALPHKRGVMDNCFKAKYAILEKVYGDFSEDTIEFIAYDHYGTPAFSKSKDVLLYVSADSGTYYHQKYLYNDVYKTKDGRWAGTYAIDDYEHPYNKHTRIKPVKIEFAEKVSFPTKILNEEGRKLTASYPRPYFKTVGDTAIAIYGNYVEELFALKKTGILTARKLFEATPEQEEHMVESLQPEPSQIPRTADDLKFLAFWKHFVASLKQPGLANFRKVTLDTLYICDKLLPTDKFIKACFNEVIDEEVKKRVTDRTKLEYTFNSIEFYNLLTSQVKKEIMKLGNSYRLRQMLVTRSTKNDNPPTICFDFVETKKGYRLYGISHHWFKECCQ